jgi:hypothetical protein
MVFFHCGGFLSRRFFRRGGRRPGVQAPLQRRKTLTQGLQFVASVVNDIFQLLPQADIFRIQCLQPSGQPYQPYPQTQKTQEEQQDFHHRRLLIHRDGG